MITTLDAGVHVLHTLVDLPQLEAVRSTSKAAVLNADHEDQVKEVAQVG